MNKDPLRHWPVTGRGVEKNIKNTYIGTIFVPNHNPPSLASKKDNQVLLLLGGKVRSEKKEDRTKEIVQGICDVRQKKREDFKRAFVKQEIPGSGSGRGRGRGGKPPKKAKRKSTKKK